MSPFSQVGLLLVHTLGGLALLIIMLRFLLQLVRADFYNPISQFLVKATNPVLIPLRRIIPGFGGLDIASLVLAYVVQVIVYGLITMLKGYGIPLNYLLIWAPLGLFVLCMNIYFWGMLITVIASWIAPGSYNPALILINQILEPVVRPVRKMMPDLGGLDLSPMVVMLSLLVIQALIVGPLAIMLNVPNFIPMYVGF
ncbi:YggT family protein [Thalassolituus hydrocarboniclasticus]|uniref:YggT family protein n=1 Tax=Thalassolituus hydrocarboniclasticus TaxID=2742796 RepID=A0ABY6AD93_9GAMM|nr:YggT family protein [Thalassolituus hydrocarboniclasticus]UXD89014.1 YggT family protein [Thalassolituus hydrocarboniclasticus]